MRRLVPGSRRRKNKHWERPWHGAVLAGCTYVSWRPRRAWVEESRQADRSGARRRGWSVHAFSAAPCWHAGSVASAGEGAGICALCDSSGEQCIEPAWQHIMLYSPARNTRQARRRRRLAPGSRNRKPKAPHGHAAGTASPPVSFKIQDFGMPPRIVKHISFMLLPANQSSSQCAKNTPAPATSAHRTPSP